MLRRLLSEYWRKETEKSKVFCGVVGLDGRCSAQAEQRKKPVAVGHLPGAYLSTETNLVPIRGVMEKEFDTGQTDTHTHTHTHTELKRCGPLGPRRFAHVTSSKNKVFAKVVRDDPHFLHDTRKSVRDRRSARSRVYSTGCFRVVNHPGH